MYISVAVAASTPHPHLAFKALATLSDGWNPNIVAGGWGGAMTNASGTAC